MNFNQDGVTGEQILKSLRAMIVDGGFNVDALIIDGFDFTKMSRERIAATKEFAKELGFSVWYSCTVKGDAPAYDKRGIPLVVADFVELVDVVIVLEPRQDHIELTVSKDRDTYNPEHMDLKLDPKTLLILV
jgi:hypothetical protein